jgi:hypothetical protein
VQIPASSETPKGQHHNVSTTKSTDYELERAASDYLSISRRAELFGPQEYERAEARAWARLQAVIDDREADVGDTLESEAGETRCAGSS